MNLRYSTDIVIFGGGVAGLWLLKRLTQEGYQAILIEQNELGTGQTLSSQGIIHGGLKYALSGNLTNATRAIADMPARWRQCLAGDDPMNLSQVKVLSEHYYMWSASSFRSKIKTFLGSKSLQGRVSSVPKDQLPEFFQHDAADGNLYQLPDFVIDTASLLDTLIKDMEAHIFQVDTNLIDFVADESGNYSGININNDGTTIQIDCGRMVFSAGEGNNDLIERCKLNKVDTQTRPLHMVYLKHHSLPEVFVHCIGDDFSMTPMLTVTSHRDIDGNTVWYLGGELAESGVNKSREEQIEEARAQVAQYFSWVDFSDAQWDSFLINRAESKMPDGSRPDDAALAEESNVIVAFPTKFTLTPNLVDRLIAHLDETNVEKAGGLDVSGLNSQLRNATLGRAKWETAH